MSLYNGFYANNQYLPRTIRTFAPPTSSGGNVTVNKKVEVKVGPQGVWGFLSSVFSDRLGMRGGLFGCGGGFLGGPGMGGGLFGCGNGLFSGPGISSMYGNGCYTPSFGLGGFNNGIFGMLNSYQNNRSVSPAEQKSNLSDVFKDFGFKGAVLNPDGTFTLHGDKGVKTGTYSELMKYAETLGKA